MERNPEFSLRGIDGRPLELSKGRRKKEILRQISRHLEYLGYNVERKKPVHDDEKPVYLISHPHVDRPRFSFKEPAAGHVLFVISYLSGAKIAAKTGEFFSKANKAMYLLKAYYDQAEDGTMNFCFESSYTGEYSKKSFSHFHDTMQSDLRVFHKIEDHDEVILGKEPTDEGGPE